MFHNGVKFKINSTMARNTTEENLLPLTAGSINNYLTDATEVQTNGQLPTAVDPSQNEKCRQRLKIQLTLRYRETLPLWQHPSSTNCLVKVPRQKCVCSRQESSNLANIYTAEHKATTLPMRPLIINYDPMILYYYVSVDDLPILFNNSIILTRFLLTMDSRLNNIILPS